MQLQTVLWKMPGVCPAEHEICFYIFIEAVLFATTVEQIVKYTEDVYFCIMYEGQWW
jgi:hypothetical protein